MTTHPAAWPAPARFSTSDHKRQGGEYYASLIDLLEAPAEPAPAAAPSLSSYDVIVVSSSGGKDSQAMLDLVVEEAQSCGVLDRVVVVHADLGRVEWEGTSELAEAQADHYGLRFIKVARADAPKGATLDLLDHVRDRGLWPGPSTRFCTSDHKRAQIARVLVSLMREARGTLGMKPRGRKGRKIRILSCLGLRAQESCKRAEKVALERNERASNSLREVDTWLPIHAWSEAEVWARIKASGVPHHRAYDLGMPRLSCVFCIFAPKNALLIAGEHNRALLDAYCEVETEIGHDFRVGLRINDIRDALEAGERATRCLTWGNA